jgi:hypothetical protein
VLNLQGLAKGIAGVAFKPLTGVLDLSTHVLKGIGTTIDNELAL